MELSAAAGSGEHSASAKRSPSRRSVKRSLEYPCVSRFRARRLLAYLRARRFDDAFESVALETRAFFRVDHLQGLARSGRWLDAIKYIARFAPANHTLGQEGQLFVNFVYMQNVLRSIVAGEEYGAFIAAEYKRYLERNPNLPPGNVKLVRILLSVLNSHKLRASVNWDLVRHKAADMLEDLIAQVSEFSDLLRMPNCSTRPRNMLPIGFSSGLRRRVKGVHRLQASDLARFYREKQKRLPSKDHCLETVSFGLSFQATARLADLLAESVEAGMCQVPRDQCPRAYYCSEGVPGGPITQTHLSTMISPAENSVISCEAIAGTKHPVCFEAEIHDHATAARKKDNHHDTGNLEAMTRATRSKVLH
ncbi:unnamed protein product [Urochloa decumbens]|uniref:Uncharacterized protein n=1 Tax=Urochloa decumbens TaxID=240449 RepID=A0ABC9D1L5_9POAL